MVETDKNRRCGMKLLAITFILISILAIGTTVEAGAICNNASVSDGESKLNVIRVCGSPVACQQTPIFQGQNMVAIKEECIFNTDWNQRVFYFYNNVLQYVK